MFKRSTIIIGCVKNVVVRGTQYREAKYAVSLGAVLPPGVAIAGRFMPFSALATLTTSFI